MKVSHGTEAGQMRSERTVSPGLNLFTLSAGLSLIAWKEVRQVGFNSPYQEGWFQSHLNLLDQPRLKLFIDTASSA